MEIKQKRKTSAGIIILIIVAALAVTALFVLMFFPVYHMIAGRNQKYLLKNSAVGSQVKFGMYEQDGNEENGKEPIVWIILDRRDGKVLLLSYYVLDCMKFSRNTAEYATWDRSEAREWLNGAFISEAFDGWQLDCICDTLINGDGERSADTTDKVFILSVEEAERYFGSDEERRCPPTLYAVDKGAYNWSEQVKNNAVLGQYARTACIWWLRPYGSNKQLVPYVSAYGKTVPFGMQCSSQYTGIRPAVWVDTGKLS